MGTITSRQSHPISYPALPEGAFTVLAVREVGPAAAPKPRLLDRVREATRARHYSRRTEKAYVAWIRRFILFHGKRHPLEMGGPEVTRFLTSLAVEGHVAGSTQNQALSALLFLQPGAGGRPKPRRPARPVITPLARRQLQRAKLYILELLSKSGMRSGMGAKGLLDNANHGGGPRLVARLSRKARLVRRATWFRDTYS